jgi:Fic family protein
MKNDKNILFSQSSKVFQGRPFLEAEGWLAGYAALINAYTLQVPLPAKLSLISHQHKRYSTSEWEVYTLRHKPRDTLAGHLTFALKYEGVDLAILNALFRHIPPEEIEFWISSEPIGRYSRRVWFFYEWLTGKRINISDAKTGNFIEAIDTKLQFGGIAEPSKRHRVHNNLPGTQDFCPLIRRTEKLEKLIGLNLKNSAHEKAGSIHPGVLARAAAFLLLKDSRASFAIEGETPVKNRAERWGRAIAQAGKYPLTIEELLRLQKIVIEDNRFVTLGLRKEGGFIGVHERSTRIPLPDHISARWQDLPRLLGGMLETYRKLNNKGCIDPVIVATIIAFGFVFIHPFADGNGRIHRYLIHHILTELEFNPKGIVFPVSAVILEHIDEYRRVLESYSRLRLEFIEWRPTQEGNVEVLNETIDLYRYFDATQMAEFLYDCVRETVEKVLPEEITYLERYDQLKKAINAIFDMPDYLADLLIRFLEQNKGKLSKRAKEKEFKALSTQECLEIENLYAEIFK